jgi:hypothetical protein
MEQVRTDSTGEMNPNGVKSVEVGAVGESEQRHSGVEHDL